MTSNIKSSPTLAIIETLQEYGDWCDAKGDSLYEDPKEREFWYRSGREVYTRARYLWAEWWADEYNKPEEEEL